MINDSGILHSYKIESNGKSFPIDVSDFSIDIKDKSFTWIHLDATEKASRIFLKSKIPFLDDLIINALFEEETRPRITEFGEGTLIILRGVNLNERSQTEDMVSIRLWVDSNHVFSVQLRSLKAIKDIEELLIAGKGPVNTGHFISMLCKRLYERMDPVFSELNEKIDAIEERIIENVNTNERQSINSIRKQAIIFRRYIAPQKDIILNLINTEKKWIGSINKRQLQENLNLIIRHVENLDLIRERAQIIKDELVAGITDKMNKNMYMLSVITAIFFPLGFLTGLLGINVGGIPGTDNTNAFFIFCGILLGVILFQILLFKKLKWF